jgi:hypothetical protein
MGHLTESYLSPLGDDTTLKPTLDWIIQSLAPAKFNAERSYVTGGMSWEAEYREATHLGLPLPKGRVRFYRRRTQANQLRHASW